MDRRVYRDEVGRWHDPLVLRQADAQSQHFIDWQWDQRKAAIASGLAEAVALYGIPRWLTYLEWVQCVLAVSAMRERAARNIEKGIGYANRSIPAPVAYHEMINGGDVESAALAADEDKLEVMLARRT